MFFGDITVIQITQLQSLIGIAVFLFGLGAAWSSIRLSVKQLSRDLSDVKTTLTAIQILLGDHTADITGLKVQTSYGDHADRVRRRGSPVRSTKDVRGVG